MVDLKKLQKDIYQNKVDKGFYVTDVNKEFCLTYLLNKVKENRYNLTLSVYKKNISAISFYKKNGFIVENKNIDKNTNEIEYTMTWKR